MTTRTSHALQVVLFALVGGGVLLVGSVRTGAAELHARTVEAFDRYVRAAEAEISAELADERTFLWIDALPDAERKRELQRVRRGEVIIESRQVRENGRKIDIPDGLVHHWRGAVFVPAAAVEEAVDLLQDYDRHAEIYAPNVARSRLVSRDGDSFSVYLRFYFKKVISVVVNSDHEARFTRQAPNRVSSRIVSTRIAEVENPDTPQESEKPVGRDGGYLWRLNSYWRFLERDGGTYVLCESISLTRGIPFGLGWIVGPFVTSIPRETLTFTLETTRRALQE